MKTDYIFWYIKRDDDVHISECAIRFYEGEVTTEIEKTDPKTPPCPVTRYRRTKRLQKSDLPHHKDRKIVKEIGGDDAVVYTQDDFGIISTDDELRKFLDKELAKDKGREPIDEQKII